MRQLRSLLVVAASMLASLLRGAEPQAAVEEPKLTCVADLADGSRIVGVAAVTELKLNATVGRLSLPFKQVAKVAFRADQETADVSLRNGDKWSGVISLATLDIQADWGKVAIPLALVRTLTVRSLGASWSARADFTTDANPNGPWSYGWAREENELFTLYQDTIHKADADGWQAGELQCVWINSGNRLLYNVRPGEISLHPGPNGEHSMVRWQAPQSCTVIVKGTFGAGDGGNVTVRVRHNATELFRAANTPKDEPFSLERNVKKDDTLDFAVGAGQTGWNGCNTPLDVEIAVK